MDAISLLTEPGADQDVRGKSAPRPNFFTETIPAAFHTENILFNIDDILRNRSRAANANVDIGFDQFSDENLAGTIFASNPALWDSLVHVSNRRDILIMEEEVLVEMQRRETIERAGGWGFAAVMLAGIASPENLIPIATGARFSGLLAKAAAGSASLGATMAGVEATLMSAQHMRTKEEALFGVGGAIILGGVLGGLTKFYTPKELTVIRDSIDREVNLKGVRQDLGPNGLDDATGNLKVTEEDFPTTPRTRREIEDIEDAERSAQDLFDELDAEDATKLERDDQVVAAQEQKVAEAQKAADDAAQEVKDATESGDDARRNKALAQLQERDIDLDLHKGNLETFKGAVAKLGAKREALAAKRKAELNQGRRWWSGIRRLERKARRFKARNLREGIQELGRDLKDRANKAVDDASEKEIAAQAQEAEESALIDTRGRNRNTLEPEDDLPLTDDPGLEDPRVGRIGGSSGDSPIFNPRQAEAEALPGITLDEVLDEMSVAGQRTGDEIPGAMNLEDIAGFLPNIGAVTLRKLKDIGIETLDHLRTRFLFEDMDIDAPEKMHLRLFNIAFTRVERLALQNEAIDIALDTPEKIAAIASVIRRRPEALADILEPIPEAQMGVGVRADQMQALNNALDEARLVAENDAAVAIAEYRVHQHLVNEADKRLTLDTGTTPNEALADAVVKADTEASKAKSRATAHMLTRGLLRREFALRDTDRLARGRRRAEDTAKRVASRKGRETTRVEKGKFQGRKRKKKIERGVEETPGAGGGEPRSSRIAPVKEFLPASDFDDLFTAGGQATRGLLVSLTEVLDKAGEFRLRRTEANASLKGMVIGPSGTQPGKFEVAMISPALSQVLGNVERQIRRLEGIIAKRKELDIDPKPIQEMLEPLKLERITELERLRGAGEGRLQVVPKERIDVAVDAEGRPVFDPDVAAPERSIGNPPDPVRAAKIQGIKDELKALKSETGPSPKSDAPKQPGFEAGSVRSNKIIQLENELRIAEAEAKAVVRPERLFTRTGGGTSISGTPEILAGGKGSPTGRATTGTIQNQADTFEPDIAGREITALEFDAEGNLVSSEVKGTGSQSPGMKIVQVVTLRDDWVAKFRIAVEKGDMDEVKRTSTRILQLDADLADLAANPNSYRVRTGENPFTGSFVEHFEPGPGGQTLGIRPDDFGGTQPEPTGLGGFAGGTGREGISSDLPLSFGSKADKKAALKRLRANRKKIQGMKEGKTGSDLAKLQRDGDQLDSQIVNLLKAPIGPAPSPAAGGPPLAARNLGAAKLLRDRAERLRAEGGNELIAEGLERQAIQLDTADPVLVRHLDPYESGEPDFDIFADHLLYDTPDDMAGTGIRTIADQVNDLEDIADGILGIPTQKAFTIRETLMAAGGEIPEAIIRYVKRTSRDLLEAGEDPLIVRLRAEELLDRAERMRNNPRALFTGEAIATDPLDIAQLLDNLGNVQRKSGRLQQEIDAGITSPGEGQAGRVGSEQIADDLAREALEGTDVPQADPAGRRVKDEPSGETREGQTEEFDFEDLDLADEVGLDDPAVGRVGGGSGAGVVPPKPDTEPKIKRHGKETGYVDPVNRKEKLKKFWAVGHKGGMSPEKFRWILWQSPKIRTYLSPYAPTASMSQRLVEAGVTFDKNKFGITPGLSVESNIRAHEAMLLDIVQRLPGAYVRMVQRLRGQTITKDAGIKELIQIRLSEFTRKVTGQGRSVQTYDDFLREIGRVMHSGDVHETIPEITEMAKYMRENLFDDVLKRYMKMGNLPEGIRPEIAKSYLTRIWNIRAIKEKSHILRELIADDWMQNLKDQKMSRSYALEMADQAIERLRAMPEGHVGWDIFGGGSKTPGPRGARAIFITVPTEQLLKHGFLETNIEMQLRFYFRSVIPDLHLMELDAAMTSTKQKGKGWKADPNLKNVFDRLESSYHRAIAEHEPGTKAFKELDGQLKSDMKDLKSFVAEMRGTLGSPGDPDSLIVRAMMTTRRFNVLRHMGTFIMSSIPDLARPFMMFGLAKGWKANYADMFLDWKKFKMNAKDAWAFGTAGDIWLNSRMDRILDFGDVSTRLSKGEELVRQSADWYGLVSGLSIWNTAIKMQVTSGVQTLLAHDLLKWSPMIAKSEAIGAEYLNKGPKHGGGTNVEDFVPKAGEMEASQPGRTMKIQEELARRGVPLEMIIKIQRELQKRVDDGHRSDRGVLEIGSQDWKDRDAAKHWGSAVRQIVDEAIVTPGVGDKSLWMSNEAGRFFGQYKTFAMAATNKMMITGMQQNDRAFWTGATMSVAFAMGSIQMKAWAGGYNTPGADKWQWWLRNGIDRSGLFGIWADANNILGYASRGNLSAGIVLGGGPDPGFKFTDRNFLTESLGPSAGMMVDIGKIFTGLTDIAYGVQPSLSASNAAKRMTPLQNHILFNRPMKALFRSGHNSLNQGMNLRRRPRKRRARPRKPAAAEAVRNTGPTPEEISLANINR